MNNYGVTLDGGHMGATDVEADNLDEAYRKAVSWVQGYGETALEEDGHYRNVHAILVVEDEEGNATQVRIELASAWDHDEPECLDLDDHDWSDEVEELHGGHCASGVATCTRCGMTRTHTIDADDESVSYDQEVTDEYLHR